MNWNLSTIAGTALLFLGCAEATAPPSAASDDPAGTVPASIVPTTTEEFPTKIGEFTRDELFAAGGGGCGMTLWRPTTAPRPASYVFFFGMDEAHGHMKIDGSMTPLIRTSGEGEEFYGQYTSQSFATTDPELSIQVNVTKGAATGTESLGVGDGRIAVISQGDRSVFAVIGDAGC